MGRNILLITTDQQRYDALGCNGGTIARTPVADRLAAEGINYRRAYNQHTVCTPARSTILTGQYVRTHGASANGIPLPLDAPSIAAYLREQAGYRTALMGKAHFEPAFDFRGRYEETRRVRLSHELEEPSHGCCVRRLLRQDVIHSGLNRWEGLRDIHKDLILGLNQVKLLEEGAAGIFISQNEVKQRRAI